MDILDDMGVSKLSAKVFLKVNYSFKQSWLYLIYGSNIFFFFFFTVHINSTCLVHCYLNRSCDGCVK